MAENQQPVSDRDAEIAFRMGVKLMTEGQGLQTIKAAIEESKDPAQVIGQFLAQIMAVLAEKLQGEINLDPRVFLAKGGWLELMLDYIEQKLGYPEEFSDQIYMQTLEVIKAAAMSPEQAQQGGGPQMAAPGGAPQGGPPQGGQRGLGG